MHWKENSYAGLYFHMAQDRLIRNIYSFTTHKQLHILIIKTNKCTNMYCIILTHTLKHLKSSYMFRSMIIIREHMQFLAEIM
jgi:hypothetical protein